MSTVFHVVRLGFLGSNVIIEHRPVLPFLVRVSRQASHIAIAIVVAVVVAIVVAIVVDRYRDRYRGP